MLSVFLATLFAAPSLDRLLKGAAAFVVYGGTLLIFVLLLLDWMTRKDPLRRFSKLLDTILGLGWVLIMGFLFVWSASMGIL
jgi:hypothetical protein